MSGRCLRMRGVFSTVSHLRQADFFRAGVGAGAFTGLFRSLNAKTQSRRDPQRYRVRTSRQPGKPRVGRNARSRSVTVSSVHTTIVAEFMQLPLPGGIVICAADGRSSARATLHDHDHFPSPARNRYFLARLCVSAALCQTSRKPQLRTPVHTVNRSWWIRGPPIHSRHSLPPRLSIQISIPLHPHDGDRHTIRVRAAGAALWAFRNFRFGHGVRGWRC